MPSGHQSVRGHATPDHRHPLVRHATVPQKPPKAPPAPQTSFWLGAPRDGFTAVAEHKFALERGKAAQWSGSVLLANAVKQGAID